MSEYVRIYTDERGDSRLETIQVPCPIDPESLTGIGRSSAQDATSFSFIEAPPDWNYEWHNAPRRQYVLLFQGDVELETSDGEIRRLRPGAVIFAEDTTGKGHITRSVGSAPVVLGVVPLAE